MTEQDQARVQQAASAVVDLVPADWRSVRAVTGIRAGQLAIWVRYTAAERPEPITWLLQNGLHLEAAYRAFKELHRVRAPDEDRWLTFELTLTHPDRLQMTLDYGPPPLPIASRRGEAEFSDGFIKIGMPHTAWVVGQLEAFNDYLPSADYHVNLAAGTLRMGKREIGVRFLGSLGTDGSWVWGWANPSTPKDRQQDASFRLGEIGEWVGVPEFTVGRMNLRAFPDPQMAAETIAYIAMGVLGARGYVGVTADTGARFYMVSHDPAIPVAPPDAIKLPRHIGTATGLLPGRHIDAAVGYFRHHGLSYQQTSDGLTADFRNGNRTAIRFDSNGRIADINSNLASGAQEFRPGS